MKLMPLALMIVFGGENLDGWIPISGQWAVKDNAITCIHAPASIRTAFESDQYTLQFEYRGIGQLFVHSRMTTSGTKQYLTAGGVRQSLSVGNADDPNEWICVRIEVAPKRINVRSSLGPQCRQLHLEHQTQCGRNGRGFIRFVADAAGLQIRNVRVSEPGFKTMFDDTSLDGWEIVRPANPDDPGWVNEKGVVRCRSRRSSWLRTLRTYDNFILRLEYEMPPAGNSGIFIRAPIEGRVSRIGMEIQLLDDAAFRGRIGAAGRTGSIYDGVAPEVQVPAPAKQWNAIEVLCDGKRVRTILNAIQLYDVQIDNAEKDTNSHKRPLATRRTVGFIGLQDHSHPVKFRRVRIQELERRPSITP